MVDFSRTVCDMALASRTIVDAYGHRRERPKRRAAWLPQSDPDPGVARTPQQRSET